MFYEVYMSYVFFRRCSAQHLLHSLDRLVGKRTPWFLAGSPSDAGPQRLHPSELEGMYIWEIADRQWRLPWGKVLLRDFLVCLQLLGHNGCSAVLCPPFMTLAGLTFDTFCFSHSHNLFPFKAGTCTSMPE